MIKEPSAIEQKLVKTYFQLMEEARTRIVTLNYAYRNDGKLPALFVREICYLQFRMLCELIAIGCLVAHGEMQIGKRLRKAYRPHEIMASLEQLNPYYYPQPVSVTQKTGEGLHIDARRDLTILTKVELPKLWAKCGDVLHHAPMASATETVRVAARSDFKDVFDWGMKLSNLLNSHLIVLADGKKALLVRLAIAGTGRAEVRVFDYSRQDGSVISWVTKPV